MAGIEVHTASPINTNTTPTKSKEATDGPATTQSVPANVAATTTAYAMNSAQSATPGAGPPAQTAAATAYTPPQPTRTTALPNISGPPPPQPGQAPEPTGWIVSQAPPQPQPSAQPQPPPPAPVTWNPSYAYAQPSKGVTSIAQDLSHPPGYIQNAQEFEDRNLDDNNTYSPSPHAGTGRGLLDGVSPLRDADDTPIWDTAVSWAKEAGRKLSIAEKEVWKRIEGEK